MIRPEWVPVMQRWDAYRAFHIGVSSHGLHPVMHGNSVFVLFDTGELILTKRMPEPNERHHYTDIGVTLTLSKELDIDLLTPTGLKVKKAWFDDSGSQWILVDHSSGRAVRTDVVLHTRDRKIKRPNVPQRFNSYAAYIGGPGCHPVGSGQFVVRPTIRDMPEAERAKIAEMERAFRAHMTLVEHEVTTETTRYGPSLPYERALAVASWEDLTYSEWALLWQNGVDRPKLKFDHLLLEPPR